MAAKQSSIYGLLQKNLRNPELQTFPFSFNCAGFDFTRMENVFAGSESRCESSDAIDVLPLPKDEGNAVLEMGSGTGCLIASLYLKKKAFITRLLAVDINPDAVQNTRLNFKNYNIPGEARESDVFSNVKEDEKFDLVFWNIPFASMPPSDEKLSMLDRSFVDVGHLAFGRYMRDVPGHLTDQGRVFIYFSSEMGDLESLSKIAATYNWQLKLIFKKKCSGLIVKSFVYELFEAIKVPPE